MKKLLLFGLTACFALTLFSCKSSQSAYRKAYDRAKAQESRNNNEEKDYVELVSIYEDDSKATKAKSEESIPVRQEKVDVVSGNSLKAFGVVVGSFSVKANAEGLKRMLENEGYKPTLGFNPEKAMYRVILSSHDTKAEAANARDRFKSRYSERKDFQQAWILHRL